MTVLFGALGLGAGLSAESGHELLARMQRGAEWTADPTVAAGAQPVGEHFRTGGLVLGASAWAGAPGAAPSPSQFAQAGAVTVAVSGRLDDAEIRATAAGSFASAARTAAETILAAYQRRGVDAVQELIGDWAFVLWDGERQRLLLARDATGTGAWYWWQGGGHLLFATTLQALLAAGPVPRRPNPRWLAGLVTVFSDPAHPTDTAFEEVLVLPQGQLLVAEGGRLAMRRWWRPETLAPLRGMAREEMHQRFVALYRDAVRQRLRSSTGSVAATLSGGLDSGSVVALAAPALAERGEVLDAYVHTPRFEADPDAAWAGRTPNEWQLANATARHVGNVRTIECPTPDVSPLQGIRRGLDVIGVPSHAACSLFWILDIVQQARVAGAGVLLVGDGGNATVSYSGTGNLWPRLQALDAAAALGELVRDEAGTWRASYRRIVKPALRPFWQWLQRSRFKTAGYSTDVTRGLINESLARHVGLEAAVAAAHHDPSFRSVHASRLALWRLGLLRGAANTATTSQMSAAFNIEVRDPTRDQRLVEFCARLPDEVFWSNGRQRGLIRTAMRSSLPPEVRDSRRKGLQAADLRARLRASQGELLSELAAVSRHEVVRDWLDIPAISAAVQAALDPVGTAHAGAIDAADALRALAVAMFLTRHA